MAYSPLFDRTPCSANCSCALIPPHLQRSLIVYDWDIMEYYKQNEQHANPNIPQYDLTSNSYAGMRTETDRRTSSPRRRVTFNDQRSSPPRQAQLRPTTPSFNATRPMVPLQRGYRGNQQRYEQQRYGTWRGPSPQTQPQQTGMQQMRCQRCGPGQHPYPNTYPASDRQCNYCSKGHFSSVCRAAARDSQMQRRIE